MISTINEHIYTKKNSISATESGAAAVATGYKWNGMRKLNVKT